MLSKARTRLLILPIRNTKLRLIAYLGLSVLIHMILFVDYYEANQHFAGNARAGLNATLRKSALAPIVRSFGNSTANTKKSTTTRQLEKLSASTVQNDDERIDPIAYFPPEETEEEATPSEVPELPLPDTDIPAGKALRFKAFISASGNIDHIEMVENELPENYSERLLAAFSKSKFYAARKDQQYVNSWKLFEIIYESSNGER